MTNDASKPVSATLTRREWVCVVDVSAPMPGTLADWPANIQDGILAAVERCCVPRRPYHELVFIRSGCWENPDKPGSYFIRVEVEELPTLLIATGHRA